MKVVSALKIAKKDYKLMNHNIGQCILQDFIFTIEQTFSLNKIVSQKIFDHLNSNLKGNLLPPAEREGMEGYINLGLEPVLEIITFEKE